MAKLSDSFLHLLGQTLASGGVSPQDQETLALQRQERDTQRLTALANASKEMNFGSTNPSPVTAGVNGATSAGPNSLSSFAMPVPGMSGMTMTPKDDSLYDTVVKKNADGEYTYSKVPKVKGGRSFFEPSSPRADLSAVSWETMTPQEQALSKSLYDGNIRASDIGYRERSKAMMGANEYARTNGLPAFQSFSGDTKAGMAKNLAYGKIGMNALSLNTAMGHVSSANDAFERIGNTNQEWLNVPLNILRKKTNDPNVVALSTTLTALRGELANVFKNSGGTDQEISQWKENLNDNLTPTQFNAVIPQIDDLLRSRLGAMEYQQGNVMGGQPSARSLLSPKSKASSERLGTKKGGNSPPLLGSIKTINSQAEYTALPSGTQYYDSHGTLATKP